MRPARRARLAVLAVLATLACRAPAPPPATPIAQTALAAAGPVVGVAELGGALYVFAPDRVAIERAGQVERVVPAPGGGWREAATIAGLDGNDWVIARGADGALWRITAAGDVEPIADRLGLPASARAIAAPGGGAITAGLRLGIVLGDGIAVVRDPAHVDVFPLGAAAPRAMATSRDRVALERPGTLEVWDLARARQVRYAVPGLVWAGFLADPRGTLVAATRDAIYLERDGGLDRLPAPAELRSVAVAGSRLWLVTARGVYVLERGRFAATTVHAAATDQVFGLAGGDAVLASAAGLAPLARLARLTIDRPDDDPRWQAEVRPIFERVCGRCHRPGGSAGVDLSSAAAWRAERGELVRRVVETRTMPPAGIPLGDAERQILARWLSR
jgi:mono/diheme cytochrome c family protein